jgi:hypothetical protein
MSDRNPAAGPDMRTMPARKYKGEALDVAAMTRAYERAHDAARKVQPTSGMRVITVNAPLVDLAAIDALLAVLGIPSRSEYLRRALHSQIAQDLQYAALLLPLLARGPEEASP